MEKYELPLKQYRVLLSDGRVFDCMSHICNNEFREWVLLKNGVTKKSDVSIEGIAEIVENNEA